MLMVEVIVGIVLGVFLTQWLSAVPHKRRVKHYKQALLHLDEYQ